MAALLNFYAMVGFKSLSSPFPLLSLLSPLVPILEGVDLQIAVIAAMDVVYTVDDHRYLDETQAE